METNALDDIAVERRRQMEVEGWSPEHDDMNRSGELALAAAAYAFATTHVQADRNICPNWWPWDLKFWKPSDRRRDLVKAAALIVAEIDRLDREADRKTQDQTLAGRM